MPVRGVVMLARGVVRHIRGVVMLIGGVVMLIGDVVMFIRSVVMLIGHVVMLIRGVSRFIRRLRMRVRERWRTALQHSNRVLTCPSAALYHFPRWPSGSRQLDDPGGEYGKEPERASAGGNTPSG
jgi:hypothetical protein